MTSAWFELHLPPERMRKMTRAEYYAATSYLRRVQHILRLRYAAAYIDPAFPHTVVMPGIDDLLPNKFK